MNRQTELNLAYYGSLAPGRADYWRYMPAPRLRVRTLLRILREMRPGSLVDMGCGDGTLLAEIAAALPGMELAGIDLSQAQIDANRRDKPSFSWWMANLEDGVPPLSLRYEAVTALELIEHLQDPALFLRSICHLAADRALLIVTTQSGFVSETERRVGHLRHFTAAELSSLLERNGWQPLRVWNAGFPFHDLSKRVVNRHPDSLMRHFGERPYGLFERLSAKLLSMLFLFNSRHRGAQLYAIARKVAEE